jgi:hypothetical protein
MDTRHPTQIACVKTPPENKREIEVYHTKSNPPEVTKESHEIRRKRLVSLEPLLPVALL